jgi:hypothetical protein
MVGVFVFCVVTVVATLSNFLNAFNLRKLTQLTLVGELKEITESFEKLDSGVSIHDHLKRIQYFLYLQNRPTFQYDRATDISKPTNKMSNYRDRVPCFCRYQWRSLHAQILWRSRLPRSILPRKLIILGHQSCAGSVGNFRCTSDTFWASGAPACQRECWKHNQEYPERHFLIMAASSKARSAGIRAQLAPAHEQAFEQVWCWHSEIPV